MDPSQQLRSAKAAERERVYMLMDAAEVLVHA